MPKSSETIENFEALLKKQGPRKTIALYSDSRCQNSGNSDPKRSYTAQDILSNVSRQLKALQSADCVKNDKRVPSDMYKYKKIEFVPLNMLPKEEKVPHQRANISKFETQCVSDTQLINIIQDAEALDTHEGITQEFETSFIHTHTDNEATFKRTVNYIESIVKDCIDDLENKKQNNYKNIESRNTNEPLESDFKIIDISLKEPDLKKNISIPDTSVISHEINDNEDLVKEYIAGYDTEINNTTQMNESVQNEEIIDKRDVSEDKNRPSSPVFGIKPMNTKAAHFSLVFDLAAFEHFEHLAAPIIERTADIEKAKHLINSQIIGKQLCFHTNTEPILNEVGEEISFIQTEKNYNIKTEDLIDVFTPKSQEEKRKVKSAGSSEISIDQSLFKDEILFSSDEEEEYMHKNVSDLPFTCVLETSFYEHSDILDKTMYVGFQTASNKSIQICTDSFFRAKSVFDSMTVDENKPTLSELVEKCDAKENIANIENEHDFVTSEDSIKQVDMVSELKEIGLIKRKVNENISSSLGLKTASGQSIEGFIDDSIRSKALLQDINNVLPSFSTEDKIFLINPSQIISQTNSATFNAADHKKIKLSNIESKNMFQETIKLRNLQLDTCNENVIENIKNKITENIAEDFKKYAKQDDFIEEYEKKQTAPDIDGDIIKEFEGVEMSQESLNSSREKVTGFKTASNKDILISDATVAKTKNIFHDIDLIEECSKIDPKSKSSVNTDNNTHSFSNQAMMSGSNNIYPKSCDISFKTASNKQIKISEQAFIKTRNIFHDIDSVEFKDAVITMEDFKSSKARSSLIDDKYNRPSTSKTFIGFKTANNNEIKISNEALLKTKNIFQDIRMDDYVEPVHNLEPGRFKRASNENHNHLADPPTRSKEIFQDFVCDLPNIKGFVGFHTASNKKVTVSNEAFEKSKKLFVDIELSDQIDRKTFATYLDNTDPVDKPVEVFDQALANNEVIFQNTDDEISKNDDIQIQHSDTTNSNKKARISEGAFDKSSKMFDEIDKNEASTGFKGFQTASNKQVQISKEALAKSRKIFDELDKVQDNKNTTSIESCRTLKNKESVAKSRNFFEEIDICGNKKISTRFEGFKTANNKQVKISEDALAKSKRIFEEIYDNKETSTGFEGFRTANNKKVKISEDAVAKSRQLFQNIDLDIKKCTQEPVTIKSHTDTYDNVDNLHSDKAKIAFTGFKTANNSNVEVSEEALLKSRKLFANIDNDQDRTYNKNKVSNLETKLGLNTSRKDDINLENIINTQVLSNFEQTLYTEDFCKETPRKSKRSGSPILSCPKAKKRKKFEIPYSQHQTSDVKNNIPSCKRQDNVQKPVQSIVFENNYKKNKKYQLRDLEALEKEYINTETHIDPYILDFDFDNLLTFQFQGKRNDVTDSLWTTDDIIKHFQDSVNKKFIPEGWIGNHLKLILWKLISYEIKFPKSMPFTCTAKNVIDQLKYRYDKELYNAERPALRKIMEKDDTSSRTIVLCVVSMFENEVKVSSIANMTNNVELLLTDGWYCIKASTDTMLRKLVADGKIVVGSKIVTNGAELVNCEEGVSPWEDTSSVRLKISGNSTRRARWDARLGYHGNAAMLCALRAVRAGGGRVARLRVVVSRVYPALYVERFDDGSTVTRSERLEHLHQMRYETERQAVLEKIYEEVEKEFPDQDSQDSVGVAESGNKRKYLDSGSQIAKVMKTSKDPLEFRSHLTDTQKSLLQEHTTKKCEKLVQKIQKRVLEKMEKEGLNLNRNVIRLLKVRVAGVEERGGAVEVTRAMLSIWKPTDAVLEMISEGCWMEVMNVVPTAVRFSEMQLSAGRQSVFSQSKYRESEILKPYTNSLKRTYYPIKDLARNPSMTTDYNEIDTVGLIFLIEPSTKDFDQNKNQFQDVYLTDASKNLICANFWGGLKKFGFENVLDTGQIVACTNLQKRAGNTRKNIPQYRVTEFAHFTKTPKNEKARKLVEDITTKLSGMDRRVFCEDCVCLKNNYSLVKLHRNAENITPYRFQNIDVNASKNRIYIDSPLPAKKVDDNLNLTGLDFESTFKQKDTQEISPKTLLRKKQVNDKIAKLKMYGEPPPLSPFQILNRSKSAGKAYKSPLLTNSDVSGVASEQKVLLNEQEKTCDISSSPIIMNRTFVKRNNVNPVKLNFESVAIDEINASDVIDHFAEDFDASPPLSLD